MVNEQPIIGPTGTTVSNDGTHTIVRFRGTDVVRMAYLDVRLDSNNTHDFVMQSRLNQASRLFRLGYNVVSRGGVWVVETPKDTYRFEDGMHLLRSPGRDHEYVRYSQ
jgi:hypothetical protein